MTPPQPDISALLYRCPESANITAQLNQFFADSGVTINGICQYTDGDQTFIRMEWGSTERWADQQVCLTAIDHAFGGLGDDHKYTVRLANTVPTVGLLCSADTNVLVDMLNRIDVNYYPKFQVPFVISDQEAARIVADRYGVPFFYISSSQSSQEIERRQIEIIERYSPDFLGLARYGSFLTKPVIKQVKCPILTVSNSFLPAIKSEKAYLRAYEDGLKLIGATSRLVKSGVLGPIVTQDSVALKPAMSLSDTAIMGQNIERKVFAMGLRKLVEHKVMVYNAKTIVFD